MLAISSDVGGTSDLIDHGRNGFLVPPGDAQALARTLLSVVRDAVAGTGRSASSRAPRLRGTLFDRCHDLGTDRPISRIGRAALHPGRAIHHERSSEGRGRADRLGHRLDRDDAAEAAMGHAVRRRGTRRPLRQQDPPETTPSRGFQPPRRTAVRTRTQSRPYRGADARRPARPESRS